MLAFLLKIAIQNFCMPHKHKEKRFSSIFAQAKPKKPVEVRPRKSVEVKSKKLVEARPTKSVEANLTKPKKNQQSECACVRETGGWK